MSPHVSAKRRCAPKMPGFKPATPAPREAPDAKDASPELWKVDRVAKALDVTRKRVYQLAQERKLEAVRLGPRQTRIVRGSVDRYLGDLTREEAARAS